MKRYSVVEKTFLSRASSNQTKQICIRKLLAFWRLSWLLSGLVLMRIDFCIQLEKALKSKVMWRELLEISFAMHLLVRIYSNLINSTYKKSTTAGENLVGIQFLILLKIKLWKTLSFLNKMCHWRISFLKVWVLIVLWCLQISELISTHLIIKNCWAIINLLIKW